jgi:hypothetical protein
VQVTEDPPIGLVDDALHEDGIQPAPEQPAVPKEQSGGDGSVQRELCVFVPDACNTFPLPTAILPVRRWLKIRVVTARRLLLPLRSRACRCVSSRSVLPTQVDSPFSGPARQALDQPLAISCFVGCARLFGRRSGICRCCARLPACTVKTPPGA